MGEENVGKILSAPTKDSSYVVYSKTDYSNIYVDSFLQQHYFSVNVNCLLRIKMYLLYLQEWRVWGKEG